MTEEKILLSSKWDEGNNRKIEIPVDQWATGALSAIIRKSSSDIMNIENDVSSSSDISSTALPVSEIIEILSRSGFVKITADGVFIETNDVFSPEKFRKLVDACVFHIAQSPLIGEDGKYSVVAHPGAYFEWLNYTEFTKLLYEESEKWTKKKIASGIKAFPPSEISWYRDNARKNTMEKDIISEVSYAFDRREVEVDDLSRPRYDLATKTITGYGKKLGELKRNPDIMIALFWVNGIQYGLQFDAITRPLSSGQELRVIAKSKLPIEGQRGSIEFQPCTMVNKKPKTSQNGGMRLWEVEMAVPEVKSGDILVVEKFPTPGKPGIGIEGGILEPDPVSSQSTLENMAGVGVRFIRNAILSQWELVATKDGFFQKDPKTSLIHVSSEIEMGEGDIRNLGGRHSSGSEDPNKTEVYENISHLGMRLPSIQCRGDIDVPTSNQEAKMKLEEWVIAAAGDIRLGGNILKDSHLLALKGDIIIGDKKLGTGGGKVFENAVIRARNGTVQFIESVGGVIIGKNIIGKLAKNSLIIGENIQLESAEGCFIICTGRATIGSITSSRSHTSHFIFSPPNQADEEEKYLDLQWKKELLKTELTEWDAKISETTRLFLTMNESLKPYQEALITIERKEVSRIPLTPTEQKIQQAHQKKLEEKEKIDLWNTRKKAIKTELAEIEKLSWEYAHMLHSYGYTLSFVNDTIIDHCNVFIGGRNPYTGPRIYQNRNELGVEERIYAAKQEGRREYWESIQILNYLLTNSNRQKEQSSYQFSPKPPEM